MISMHSDAYKEFIQRINTDGYKQGYNSKLFELILPEERESVEKIVEEKYDKGDRNLAIFMPKLSHVDGISKLIDDSNKLKKTCSAYSNIMCVLYHETRNEDYLDNIINILKSDDEYNRSDALADLLRCGKSNKLYEVYKKQCIIDEDEDIRCRCVNGMMYCKNIIKDPFFIQLLKEPWKRLKLEMFNADINQEDRIKAIKEFEELVNNKENI